MRISCPAPAPPGFRSATIFMPWWWRSVRFAAGSRDKATWPHSWPRIRGGCTWRQRATGKLRRTHGASLYFRNNCIRLGCNADTRRICRIEVGAGYQGRLWGEVRVGDTLASAMRHTELHYDSGEELYYPQRPGCGGVAFYGLEAGAGTMPNVEIQFIVVDGAALERD